MIDCLINFIGLRGACDELASGGLWINDMPDAGIPKMEALSDVHSRDFKGLWDKVYGRACDHFATDIRKLIQPRIKTNDVVRNVRTGVFDFSQPIYSDAFWSGEMITLYGSDFMELFIDHVEIYATPNNSIDISILVLDADTGFVLNSKSYNISNELAIVYFDNQIAIPINGKRRIWVGYNQFLTDSYTVTNSADGCDCKTKCSTSSPMGLPDSYNPGITPINFQSFIPNTYAKGISVIYGVRCSLNQFICMNRDVLSVSLRWKAYIELLAEQLWNDSITNKYTLLPAEELQNRMTAAQLSYQDELSGILKSITWDADSICWECNETASIIYRIP